MSKYLDSSDPMYKAIYAQAKEAFMWRYNTDAWGWKHVSFNPIEDSNENLVGIKIEATLYILDSKISTKRRTLDEDGDFVGCVVVEVMFDEIYKEMTPLKLGRFLFSQVLDQFNAFKIKMEFLSHLDDAVVLAGTLITTWKDRPTPKPLSREGVYKFMDFMYNPEDYSLTREIMEEKEEKNVR